MTACLGLVAYVALAYLVLPDELPPLLQRVLGLLCAAGAVVAYVLTTRHVESAEEMLLRVRRGQHADFGKRLRKSQGKRGAIKLPILGEISYRMLGGVAVFLVVGGWWLSPLAPVRVKPQVVEDLSVPLGKEIAAVVLFMPDAHTAALQPPILPQRARDLAERIHQGADSYQLGRKALAEGRFEDARRLLQQAAKGGVAQPHEVHLALAQNEMYAGRFPDAVKWYETAVQERPDDLMLSCQLAVARMQAGRFDDTEPLISKAVARCRQKQPAEGDPALAYLLHAQAVLSVGLGKEYDEAGFTCLQARQAFQKAIDGQDPFVAASLNNQATLYLLQAKYPGAEELYHGARRVWTETLGPKHPHVAASLANLAMVHYNLGRYANAQQALQRALTIRTQSKSLPDRHPIIALNRNAIAMVKLALGRYGEARQLAEKALADCETALGREHSKVAPVVETLAALYGEVALYNRAEALYLRAAAITRWHWGETHPHLAGILNGLAGIYVAQGRCGKADAYQQAEGACQQAVEISEQAFGEDHPGVAAALSTRGSSKIQRGQLLDARPDLERALKIQQEALGDEHPDVALTMANLAALDRGPRFYAEGVERYKRAIKMAEKFLGPEHPKLARLWYGLGLHYILGGEVSEAGPCLDRALAIQEKTLVAFHPDLAATLEAYAPLLRKTEPGRAAKMLSRAKKIRGEHAEKDRPE